MQLGDEDSERAGFAKDALRLDVGDSAIELLKYQFCPTTEP